MSSRKQDAAPGRLDHVGVAVRSLEDALAPYQDGLGLAVTEIEVVPTEQVRIAFLPVGETRLELLEPTGDDSPIARFLNRRGKGFIISASRWMTLKPRWHDSRRQALSWWMRNRELVPGGAAWLLFIPGAWPVCWSSLWKRRARDPAWSYCRCHASGSQRTDLGCAADHG